MDFKIMPKEEMPIILKRESHIKYQSIFDRARKMTFNEVMEVNFKDMQDATNALVDMRSIIEIYKQHSIVFNVRKFGYNIYIWKE